MEYFLTPTNDFFQRNLSNLILIVNSIFRKSFEIIGEIFGLMRIFFKVNFHKVLKDDTT